ncbi:MAG TPA: FAD-dependent monooxygenase [Propionibacteriaceae bacterium]
MVSMNPTVLISGASIAGPALAYWLHLYGYDVTVVERAAALREGGQNVDVRGAGREVSRRMGVEDAIRAASTGEVGLRFVDAGGQTIGAFPVGTSDSGGATAELEILRGDLARLLVERTQDDATYVYGDHITGLDERADRVHVTFAHGPEQSFDLVVAADGIRSTTRTLVVGDEAEVKPLGMYTAWMTIPKTASDDAWWRWFNAPGGRSVNLRPDNVGTTRATLSFMSEPQGYERLDTAGVKDLLRQHFAGVGWEVPRILAALDETDVYFEAIGQVRAPHWSRGRVALLGDAAYCASPISGMGTSLALTGAYVLAGELSRQPDHVQAFAAYEKIMRPYVDQAQQLPPGTPQVANPRTRIGVAAFHTAVRIGATKLVSKLVGKVLTPPADKIDLPDYEAITQPGRRPIK